MIEIANLNRLPLLQMSKTQHDLSSFSKIVCVKNKTSRGGVSSGVVHYEQTGKGFG